MRRTSSSPEISVLLFVDSMNIDGVVSVYDYLGCSECGDKIRASLLNKPVNELVVMSRSFGSKLRAELLEEGNLKGIALGYLMKFYGTIVSDMRRSSSSHG